MWTKYCHHYVKNCAKLMSSQVMNFQFTYLRCKDPKVILLSLLCQVITRLFFLFFFKEQFNELYGMRQPFFLLESQPKVNSERSRELEQKLGMYLEFSIRDWRVGDMLSDFTEISIPGHESSIYVLYSVWLKFFYKWDHLFYCYYSKP